MYVSIFFLKNFGCIFCIFFSIRRTLETLKLRKQRSTGDIRDASVSPAARRRPGAGGSVRSTISYGSTRSSSTGSGMGGPGALQPGPGGGSQASFLTQDDITDLNMIESYYGEWKNDKRLASNQSIHQLINKIIVNFRSTVQTRYQGRLKCIRIKINRVSLD